ncbi:MAG: hypothetical protein ACLU4J_03240 [Butyricimonas paravirosa]
MLNVTIVSNNAKKVIQVMRIVCFLMMLGLTSVYANSFPKGKCRWMSKPNTAVRSDQLQEQSGYTFLFSSEDERNKGISKATREELFDLLKNFKNGISFDKYELVILRKEQIPCKKRATCR